MWRQHGTDQHHPILHRAVCHGNSSRRWPRPVLLIEFSGDQHGGYEGLVMLGAILTMGVIASAYAAVVSIIGFALLRMLKKRSLGLGILYGLGTGAAIGATLVILAMAVV